MAIESYRAAEMQLASEARSEQYPGIEIVISVMRKIAGLGSVDFTKLEELSLDAIQKNSKGNLQYLFESLVQDVERIDRKLGEFESAGRAERDALNELISEAVARAAEAKSKDRVRRVARILANSLRSGPKQNYEKERELIDTAVQVADFDASILGVMMTYQGPMVKRVGAVNVNDANKTWEKMSEENKEFKSPRIQVACARLQAQGLIIRMDRVSAKLDLVASPYSLTEFGVRFCEWCLVEAETSAVDYRSR